MRSKVILSVLVCLALLLSLGVAVKEVKADAIMFPWIIKNTGVTSTLISVVNTAGVPVAGVYAVSGVPFELHYEYWWKTGGQTDVCDEWDFRKPTSKDDIVTFEQPDTSTTATRYSTITSTTYHMAAPALI